LNLDQTTIEGEVCELEVGEMQLTYLDILLSKSSNGTSTRS